MRHRRTIREAPQAPEGGVDAAAVTGPPRTQAELQSALALNGMGSFQWDLDADVFYLDRGGLAVFDLRPGDYDGRTATLSTRILPEDLGALRRIVDRNLASQPDYGAYFRVRRTDGSIRWTHTQGHILRDATGRARRVVGIVRDASRELTHLAEQAALRAARQRAADVVESLTAALAQALSVDDVTTAVVSETTRAKLDATAISLGVVEHGRARLVAASGLPDALTRDVTVARLDEALPFAEAARTGMPRFLGRDEFRDRYPTIWPYLENTDMTRCAVLPLIAQAQPVGALAIVYGDDRGFSAEERNLLVALGATVAQSLQRAMLYDSEHELAVGLQRAMLPARIPDCPGTRIAARYRPCGTGHHIGGDWYDVVPLPLGNVGITVGDVQGHDAHAAAVMGQLRIALRAYAAEGHPPHSVIARASAFLRDLDTERFATCIYVDLDPATGRAWVTRAGHLGPLVRHSDSSCSCPYVPDGVPLGLPPDTVRATYVTTELRLQRGDTLLMCTDGLVEFHGIDIDEGLRRLESTLGTGPERPEHLADHIIDTIRELARLDDDVALLLVELCPDR